MGGSGAAADLPCMFSEGLICCWGVRTYVKVLLRTFFRCSHPPLTLPKVLLFLGPSEVQVPIRQHLSTVSAKKEQNRAKVLLAPDLEVRIGQHLSTVLAKK